VVDKTDPEGFGNLQGLNENSYFQGFVVIGGERGKNEEQKPTRILFFL
jgi:hypothetical protein